MTAQICTNAKLLVANYSTSNVTTYTNITTTPTFSGSLIASGGGLNNPNSILLYRDTLYVANGAGGTAGAGFIRKYNPVTGAQYGTGNFTSGLSFPERMVIGPDGNMYVADYNSNSIKRININNGVVLNTFTLVTLTGQNVLGIEFVGTDMYVTRGTISNAAGQLGRIERYTFSNNYTTLSLPTLVTSYTGATPRGITLGPDGLIYVVVFVGNATASSYAARIERFAPGLLITIPATFVNMDAGSNPYQGLNWSPDGFLYVADFGEGIVQVYNSSGTEITSRNVSGLSGPHFVQFYCPCAATTVFTPSSLTACSGSPSVVQITTTNANPQITYRYASSSPNTIISGPTTTTASSTSITINSTTTSTFSVTITDRIGCSAVAGGTLSINALPTPTLTNATICAGQTATLTATGGTSYTLANTGAVNTTGVFSVTPSSTTAYTVTAANSNNCRATATGTVTVNQVPIVTLNAVTVCAGQTATLTATSGFASYTFSPGLTQVGGSAGNTATIVGSGTATTAYSVTAASSAGCLGTASGSVTVRAVPVATAVSTTATCASPATVSGTSSLTGSSFSWTGPGAFASAAQSFTTNTPGTYTLVVTTNGCSANAVTATVVSNTAPPALTLSSVTVCAGQTATLTATPGLSNYMFSAGLTQVGGATGNTATVVGSGSATTAYSVTATNAAACTAVANGSVTVRPNPVATAVSTTATCASPATVSGTSSLTGSSFSWTGPGAFASAAQSFTTNTPGTYTLVVTTDGCSSSALTTTVLQDIVVPQNVAATNTGPITCAQLTATVSASSSTGGVTYRWSGPNSFTSSAPSFIVSVPGLYSVTVSSANGCTAVATTSVISNTGAPTATVSSTAICAGQTATITAGGGTGYGLNPGNLSNTTGTFMVTPANTTTYTVVVTGSNSCTAVAQGTVTVNPLPTASVTPDNTTSCAGQTATLTASGGTGYRWSTAATTAIISVTSTGTYSVTVSSANGCTAVASTSVTVNPLPQLTVSSATVCAGTSAALTLGGCEGGTIRWSTGSASASLLVTPLVTTTYSVTCTLPTSCFSTTAATVAVTGAPTYGVNPTLTLATCLGNAPNNDAQIDFTALLNTARADIVPGNSYGAGPAFGAPSNRIVANNTVSFTNLPNPTQPQNYTVRLFGTTGSCLTDVVVTVTPAACPCLVKCVVPALQRIANP